MKDTSNPRVLKLFLTTIVIVALVTIYVSWNHANATKYNEIVFDQQPPILDQPILGAENAPVTVVEFGDFKCPGCKAWGERIFPQLINDYIVTGKVKFAYINVLFHGEESKLGSLAAEAVLKQSPENYWLFHKALFDEQPLHQNHDDLWITNDKIIEIASKIEGIDVNLLQESLENQTEMDEVMKDDSLVSEYNIKLTPTIMVNGIMLEDPFDYERITSLIEQELKGKK